MDKIKDEASVDLMCTLGGPAIHGLSHCEHVEQVATNARIVVLECSELSNEEIQRTIDTLRARCAMARILGLFRPECAHRADEALSLGADDVVVGPEHLRRTLSALRWEVAIVEGFLEKQLSHQRLVGFIQRISAAKELNDVLQTAVSALEDILGIERVSVVLARPGNEKARSSWKSSGDWSISISLCAITLKLSKLCVRESLSLYQMFARIPFSAESPPRLNKRRPRLARAFSFH